MNKKELIKAIAEEKGMTQKTVAEMVDTVVEAIMSGMKTDKVVDIYGFAKFEAVYKESRECRNPQTGETMMTTAAYSPKVKFSSKVKSYLND